MSDQLVEDFLEHHGVRGQKWGQRRLQKGSAKFQKKRLDPLRRVARGNASFKDKFRASMSLPLWSLRSSEAMQNRSRKQIKQARALQKKVSSGQAKARDFIMKFGGVDIRQLNYRV